VTVKRDPINQKFIDAAKVMPGTADPEQGSDPAETPAVKEAEKSGPYAPTTRRGR
jgi:hypothetical protein